MSTKYAIAGGKLIGRYRCRAGREPLVLVDDNGKIEYAGAQTFLRALRLSTPRYRPSGLIDTHLHPRAT